MKTAIERKQMAIEFFNKNVKSKFLFFHLVKIGTKWKQFLVVAVVEYEGGFVHPRDITNYVSDITGFKWDDKSGYIWTSGNNETDMLYHINRELGLTEQTGLYTKA